MFLNALSARLVHVHGGELFITCCHCVLCAANLLQPCTPSTAGFWTSGVRTATMGACTPGTEAFGWKNYATSTAVAATYTNWATGQPNCATTAPMACIQLTTAQFLGERWDDVDCATAMSCAICELDI